VCVCVWTGPDAEDPVQQKASQEAEEHVRPRVPGVQLHEGGRVQTHILHTHTHTHRRQSISDSSTHSLSWCFITHSVLLDKHYWASATSPEPSHTHYITINIKSCLFSQRTWA